MSLPERHREEMKNHILFLEPFFTFGSSFQKSVNQKLKIFTNLWLFLHNQIQEFARSSTKRKLGILDFLHRHGMKESYRIFRLESGLEAKSPIQLDSENLESDQLPADPLLANPKFHNLLDKKWVTILRLQKRILDMEAKSIQEKEAIEAARSGANLLPSGEAGKSLEGHRSPITRLAFHPRYTVLCTASEDSTIKVWDYETGEFERTLKGHTKAVHDIAFSPKGTLLASCSSDLSLKLWDVANDYNCSKTLHGHDHTVSGVQFTASGDHLISASRDKSIKIWEVSSGYCLRTITGHSDWVRYAQPSLDGKLIVSCSNDQSVRVWDFNTGECKIDMRGHTNVIEVVMFAPVDSYLYIRELLNLQSSDMSPSQYIFSAARDKTIRLFNIQGQLLHTFIGHDNWVRGLVIQNGGQYLISCADDKTCKVWDLKTGRAIRTLRGHEHFVTCLSLAANGNVLATGSVDLTTKLWKCS